MSLPTRHQVGRAFGSLLRTARNGAGLSQEELAERANMDRTYPSLLERGLRTPSLLQLLNIGNALKIQPGMLVDMTAARLQREGQP
jgi:transcriptional regulator with XRE-family HTH domain